MIPVYKINWCNPQDMKQRVSNAVLSWSSQNWIVFCTGHVWYDDRRNSVDILFILNPNQPWEAFPLRTEHHCCISQLQWSEDGMRFVSVGVDGIAKVWSCENDMMNHWNCVDTFDFGEGEKVSKMFWVNTRSKYQIDVDKATHKDIAKRFSAKKTDNILFSLTESSDCFVVVLSSGVVRIVTLQNGEESNSYFVRLGSIKCHVIKADVCLSDNGKIFVAAQTGEHTVEVFTINCKHTGAGLDFQAEVWPCIVPHANTKDKDFSSRFKITDIKCVSVGSSDQIIMSTVSDTASCIQLYEIKKEPVALHHCFARQQNSQPNADAAVCLKSSKFQGHFQSMFISKLRFNNLGKSKDMSLSPKVVIIDASGVSHVYSIYNWQQILQPMLIESLEIDHVNEGVFSPTDHCVFTLTERGAAMLFVLPHFSMCSDKTKVRNVANLLHYCFVESFVPWDVMVFLCSCDRTFIEQCLQTLIEDYGDSNFLYQNVFRSAYLATKSMFYQILRDYCGVLESYYSQMLLAIYNYVKSQLQSDREAVLSETIHKICATSKEIDINKIVAAVDTKDVNMFFANGSNNRPIIQWLTDYTIHLARLILSKNHHDHNWKSILKYFDLTCFVHLRPLLILMYISYQKYPNQFNINPIFSIMTNSVDITAQLFRLVTKLQQILTGENLTEIALNDLPFNNLPMMYLEFPSIDPKNGVLSTTTVVSNPTEIDHYEFQLQSDSWDSVRRIGVDNPLTCGISTVHTCSRQIYDGINLTLSSLIRDEVLKQCSHCGCLSIYQANPSRLLNPLWVMCWSKHCVCGGLWKKVEWQD